MRILVVEDNARLSEMISDGLGASGYITDNAYCARDAEGFLQRMEYDLIVLDLGLPDASGADLLRTLRARRENIPVLVVTARIDTSCRVQTLEEGADDYLGKPFHLEELIARVRAILRRPRELAESVLTVSNLTLDLKRLKVEINGQATTVSRREMHALHVLMRYHGNLVPRRKLERALYSFDEEFTPNALEAVVSRLRKKLEVSGAAVDISAMRGIGYILAGRI